MVFKASANHLMEPCRHVSHGSVVKIITLKLKSYMNFEGYGQDGCSITIVFTCNGSSSHLQLFGFIGMCENLKQNFPVHLQA